MILKELVVGIYQLGVKSGSSRFTCVLYAGLAKGGVFNSGCVLYADATYTRVYTVVALAKKFIKEFFLKLYI